VLVGGYLHGRERTGQGAGSASVACVLASAALLPTAVTGLLGGVTEGVVLLALGAWYGLLAGSVLSYRRDLSTWLWSAGLLIVIAAWDDLVVAWASAGVILAWCASRTGEARLRLGALAPLGLALLEAMIVVAPPRRLFVAGAHPGNGVLALAATALAAAALAFLARSAQERPVPRVEPRERPGSSTDWPPLSALGRGDPRG
jgi:hypothetical protein